MVFSRFILLALILSTAWAQPRLGDAPLAPPVVDPGRVVPRAPVVFGSWLDPTNRSAIDSSYSTVVVGLRSTPTGWIGNLSQGNAGTTSQEWKDAVLSRINFMRAIAGVPPVITLNSTYNTKDQDAAMMMSSNNQLSHKPPASWINYTPAGAEAAENSNLCLLFNITDAGCVEGYMRDDGSNNAAVGHRRWILYPQTQQMGTGDIPQHQTYSYSNAMWVFDGLHGTARPATRDAFVAWPPRGYVPAGLVPSRWSFSYPLADFGNATVTVARGASTIPVTIEPVATGYGENTIVFIPSGAVPVPLPGDTSITVTVSNFRLNGVAQSVTYDVIVFNSGTTQAVTMPLLQAPGNGATGVATSTNLTWNAATGATSYDVYFGTSSNPPFLASITGTSQAVSALQANTTYYWKVVAKGGTASVASAIFSFTTGTSLPAPVLTAPINGLFGAPLNPTLTWDASAGATSYDVYFGNSSNPPLATNTTGTSYSPSSLAAGTTYYWKVVAKNASASAESPVYSFATAAATISAPTLTAPANSATGVTSTTNLTWTASANATSYDVYLGTISNPPFVGNVTGTSFPSGPLVLGTTYYWKVAAKLGNSVAESATFSFTTQAVGAPTLTSPANGATGVAANATLSWTAPAGATSYDLYFGTGANPPLSTTLISTSQQVTGLQTGTTYSWRVVAKAGSSTASSATFSFTTAGAPPALLAPNLLSPIDGATGVTRTPALSWSAVDGATSYDVSFGTANPPSFAANVTGTSYSPGELAANTTYYWRVTAKNASTSSPSGVRSFTTGATTLPSAGYNFRTIAPCRIADTRLTTSLNSGATRDIVVTGAPCDIPVGAKAVALNVTVVPKPVLGFLTIWPAGDSRPLASTLNAPRGGVVANAAIVPVGTGGAISVYASDATDVIIDASGYFIQDATASAFYPVAPCRAQDTREAGGILNGTRNFSIGCTVPTSATAVSLNATVVPSGSLGYLTLWNAGGVQPFVSTLNSPAGKVVANAAIVPTGTAGAISAFSTSATHLVLDTNGYFGAPSVNGLSFYPVLPCRVADTRNTTVMAANSTRSFPIAGTCGVPANAQAFALNATVVPRGALGYLTLWPTGQQQPFVSTLNATDGNVLANAAIVPAGSNGSISAFVTDATDLVLDINGYFAP